MAKKLKAVDISTQLMHQISSSMDTGQIFKIISLAHFSEHLQYSAHLKIPPSVVTNSPSNYLNSIGNSVTFSLFKIVFQ